MLENEEPKLGVNITENNAPTTNRPFEEPRTDTSNNKTTEAYTYAKATMSATRQQRG